MATLLYANHRIRVNSGICRLVKRTLKGPGTILASKNAEVSPHDVLGHYKLTAGFTKVNLANELNVRPLDVKRYLKKEVGRTVFKGELLAQKKGLFGTSQIIAPTDSIFESLNDKTGEATLRLIPKDVSLTSGVFGVVQDIDAVRGEVSIKCMSTEVYGILGTGSEKEGFMNVISGPGDLVNASQITTAHRGQILVAGSLVMEEAIKKALTCNVSGIICGGLNMDDYLSMAVSLVPSKRVGTEIGISLIATEGFGLLPIGEDFEEIFGSHNNKFAIVNGNLGMILLPSNDPDSILGCRKVSLPDNQALGARPELGISEIKIGLKVRLIWPPFMGTQGVVKNIDETPTTLDSGISTYMLTIDTKTRKMRVPYSNVEII
ncbi:hypothetical protein HYW44_01990 [Candidatus Daviesbacteria bacterium]|nr:hypothetical protein [Candidatus Daviesbacteria bacterium]